jgi:hypothetical protein
MSNLAPELIAGKGKFTLWMRQDEINGHVVTCYEIRRGDVTVDELDNEREAMSELDLQDRLEVQARAFGPGM